MAPRGLKFPPAESYEQFRRAKVRAALAREAAPARGPANQADGDGGSGLEAMAGRYGRARVQLGTPPRRSRSGLEEAYGAVLKRAESAAGAGTAAPVAAGVPSAAVFWRTGDDAGFPGSPGK